MGLYKVRKGRKNGKEHDGRRQKEMRKYKVGEGRKKNKNIREKERTKN